MTTPDSVRKIISAGGGRIAGKTRLQKTAYFLEVAGVGYGFDFSYHYYGPYSEELAVAAADAEALKLIKVNQVMSSSGTPYAVYESLLNQENGQEGAAAARRKELLEILERYDAISLELAATADFLARNGYAKDPWTETRRRKSVKAESNRVEKAKLLLDELRIPMPCAA